jgi:hypothetical protein
MRPVRLAPIALVGLLLAAPSSADRLPARATHVVDYDISVTLDAASHRLNGRQRLVWRNPSSDSVGDLWFHLYLNAFKNTRTTFYRESGGQLRGDRMAAGRWGWIDVTSMALADGRDLLGSLRFEAPDDGNRDDQTVARVVLPEPVPPGGQVALDIAFTAQLPQVFARTGYYKDFHLVGQWFPKLGVYEPAGRRGRASGGWNCHQFHATSEFYADLGRFRVAITVPASVVSAVSSDSPTARASASPLGLCWTAASALAPASSRYPTADRSQRAARVRAARCSAAASANARGTSVPPTVTVFAPRARCHSASGLGLVMSVPEAVMDGPGRKRTDQPTVLCAAHVVKIPRQTAGAGCRRMGDAAR